jgi:hypothetical protein
MTKQATEIAIVFFTVGSLRGIGLRCWKQLVEWAARSLPGSCTNTAHAVERNDHTGKNQCQEEWNWRQDFDKSSTILYRPRGEHAMDRLQKIAVKNQIKFVNESVTSRSFRRKTR